VSEQESRTLASAIPSSQQILMECDFFLDTIFRRFYTFVNCKESLAGSMSTRQRENRTMATKKAVAKKPAKKAAKKAAKKKSPDVLLGKAASPLFMRVCGASVVIRRGLEQAECALTPAVALIPSALCT
jgi:hypothetical protein